MQRNRKILLGTDLAVLAGSLFAAVENVGWALRDGGSADVGRTLLVLEGLASVALSLLAVGLVRGKASLKWHLVTAVLLFVGQGIWVPRPLQANPVVVPLSMLAAIVVSLLAFGWKDALDQEPSLAID